MKSTNIVSAIILAVILISIPFSQALTYPGDCRSSTLRRYAQNCGLEVTAGRSHYLVRRGAELVTTIPHSVKSNGTCRSIINTLNGLCEGSSSGSESGNESSGGEGGNRRRNSRRNSIRT